MASSGAQSRLTSSSIEDAEAEKALTIVTGRPVFFLKTNGMLRGRRDRHPVQRSELSQTISDVFADAEEAELTAATVEEAGAAQLLTSYMKDALATATLAECVHGYAVARHGRASAVWQTERGRGEPPTLHVPHTPVVRSVTRAHTRHV